MVSPQSHTSSSATSAVSTTTPRQHISATPQQHVAATHQQQPATQQHQGVTTPSAATNAASQQYNYLPTTTAGHASLLRHDESNLPPSMLFDQMYEFPVVKVEEDENFI